MAAKVQQGFDHLQMAFVNSYVQWSLPSLVPGIQVSTAPMQHLNDRTLITKGRMVHCPVTIFVLGTATHPHNDSVLCLKLAVHYDNEEAHGWRGNL